MVVARRQTRRTGVACAAVPALIRSQHFPAQTRAVGAARRFAAAALADQPVAVTESALLMVSELATNAVTHGNAEFDVTVDLTAQRLRVTVSDAGPGFPTLGAPVPGALCGRGLVIVAQLATAWGVDGDGDGRKTVWFTLEAASARR